MIVVRSAHVVDYRGFGWGDRLSVERFRVRGSRPRIGRLGAERESGWRGVSVGVGEQGAGGWVARAHREAIGEAMAWAQGEVAWTRVGYHGRTAAGRSVGRYEPGTGLVWTRWDHRTNRACEPQLHSHVAVLNRVVTASDGQIRA